MLSKQFKRVMVLAPHTDDGEFGCGGAIARFLEEGSEVYYSAFSACEQSLPPPFEPDTLKYELLDAMSVFGIPEERVFLYSYQVRRFPEFRQGILQDIIDKKLEIQPDIVFMPCMEDMHQDHQVVAMEGLRAYKDRTVVSYEMPWNNLNLNTSTFFKLDRRHIDKKIEALGRYKSQAGRSYSNPEFIESLARTRGVQIGCKFAEVFETVRWVV